MKINYPKLNKQVEIVSYLLIALIVISGGILIYNPHFSYLYDIMNGHRYFMASFAVYGVIYLLINKKSKLVYFVVVATLIFVSGALTALFMGNIMYMLTGAAIESLVFTTGLAYSIQSSYRQKIRSEKEANMANESALRAQLNPHFIFNSLNSIQHLITQGDKENALRYLTKFSKLLRQVLDNSIEINVPLKREIELLTMYLELESLRFNNEFEFTIQQSEQLDVHNIEVPLFLVQPFVENAILHGLMLKPSGTKKLLISFDDGGDELICIIEDNGIGRQAAKAQQKHKKQRSYGIKVAAKRLKALNKNNNKRGSITYFDLEQGTKVVIHIPKN